MHFPIHFIFVFITFLFSVKLHFFFTFDWIFIAFLNFGICNLFIHMSVFNHYLCLFHDQNLYPIHQKNFYQITKFWEVCGGANRQTFARSIIDWGWILIEFDISLHFFIFKTFIYWFTIFETFIKTSSRPFYWTWQLNLNWWHYSTFNGSSGQIYIFEDKTNHM